MPLQRWIARGSFEFYRRFDTRFDVVFVTGMSGSGTSLLFRLLDQRFHNAAAVETTFKMPPGSPIHMQRVDSHRSLHHYRQSIYLPDALPDRRLRALFLDAYRSAAYRTIKTASARQSNVVLDKAPILHQVRAQRLKRVFPSCRFVQVLRDPVYNVEGLRRKWALYGQADLAALCDFWEEVHSVFAAATTGFRSEVMTVVYEHLLQDVDGVVAEVARFCNLQPRAEWKVLKDRPNVPNPGLRNVVGGVIQVVDDYKSRPLVLSASEQAFVSARLGPIYDRLAAV